MSDATAESPVLARWNVSDVIALIILIGALTVIMAPWRADGLKLRDFSEFVPILRAHGDVWSQWGAVNDYYRLQGRGNVLTNGLIVAGWHFAGERAARWQTMELAMLVGVGIALFGFCRASGMRCTHSALL